MNITSEMLLAALKVGAEGDAFWPVDEGSAWIDDWIDLAKVAEYLNDRMLPETVRPDLSPRVLNIDMSTKEGS